MRRSFIEMLLILTMVGGIHISLQQKAHAQDIADSCYGCYKGYRFDTTFWIGAIDNSIGQNAWLKGVLQLDYVRHT